MVISLTCIQIIHTYYVRFHEYKVEREDDPIDLASSRRVIFFHSFPSRFSFPSFFSLRAIYELYLKEKRNRLIWLDLDRTCDLKFPFIREYSLLILYNLLNFEEWRNTQYFVNRLLIVHFIGIKNRSSFDRGMHVIINHNRSRWPLCMKRCRDTYRSRWIIYKYSYGVNESSAILVP